MVEQMGFRQRSKLTDDLTPRFPSRGGYVPHVPHPPQQAFLLLSYIAEVFYGGAAGGGKSDAGLMATLQFADVPGYSALVLRRTYQDLALPGAIMARAEEWLSGTPAKKKDGGKLWEFPTNDPSRPATLRFGYAASHSDVYRYQSSEFQTIFFDELTHFEERTYRYLFSRLRGPALPCVFCHHQTSQVAGERRGHDEDHDYCACGHEHQPWKECEGDVANPFCGCQDYRPVGCECVEPEPDRDALTALGTPVLTAADDGTTLADVPLRMRSGSNPGGLGHEWVRSRFVDPKTKLARTVFIPAKLNENPSLDRRAYRAVLAELTSVERARLEDGNWDVADDGDVFERGWFRFCDLEEVPHGTRWLRYWDLAATVEKVKKRRTDPDWTVGALLGLSTDGRWWLRDIRRFRKAPLDVENEVRATAALDGRGVPVRMEQEPGNSGVSQIDHYRREVLVGYDFDGDRPTLSKEERAAPMSKAAQAGNFTLVSAAWNQSFVDEAAGFPNLPHDDQIDGVSGAFNALAARPRARLLA
jgi:predicted phage terminase large subunit-like protein